jgi:hypothetical protein
MWAAVALTHCSLLHAECQACAEGSYQSSPCTTSTDRQCASCLSRFSNCAACTSSGCTLCASGYWLDGLTGTCMGMGLVRHLSKAP